MNKLSSLYYFFEYKNGRLVLKLCGLLDYGRLMHQLILDGKTSGKWESEFVYHDN